MLYGYLTLGIDDAMGDPTQLRYQPRSHVLNTHISDNSVWHCILGRCWDETIAKFLSAQMPQQDLLVSGHCLHAQQATDEEKQVAVLELQMNA